MFGSLVMCLPSEHLGGELVLRHDSRTVKFEGSAVDNTIKWIAFYSDCEHEVLPVKKGYRLTLTYNLYCSGKLRVSNFGQAQNTGQQLIASPFGQNLFKLLASDFYPDGAVIGIGCEHGYAHTSYACSHKVERVLKGNDALIFATAKALGLKTQVFAVIKREGKKKKTRTEYYHFPPRTSAEIPCDAEDSDAVILEQALSAGQLLEDDVVWLQHPEYWEQQFHAAQYGNEPSVREFYSGAAIFINIPEARKRTGSLA